MSSQPPKLTLPTVGEHLMLSQPSPRVLQVKMNRPKQLNAMSWGMEQDMAKVFDWYEQQPSLWCAILTGNGRGFCAGQDLKSFMEAQKDEDDAFSQQLTRMKNGGFGSVSTRRFNKPVIAAVDGYAMGGGTELAVSGAVALSLYARAAHPLMPALHSSTADLVIATSRSVFGLPEATRGVVAAMGGIARISQVAGHQRAAEMLLACNPISAAEAHDRFGFVNAVVQLDKSESVEKGQARIEAEALRWAEKVCSNSPDSIIVSKQGLDLARDVGKGTYGIDETTVQSFESAASAAWRDGDNVREGVMAFFEKRTPQWTDPAGIIVERPGASAKTSKL